MKVKAVSMAAIGVLLAGGVSAEVMLRDDFSANAPGENTPLPHASGMDRGRGE